jgi:hypothetical protein
LEEKTVSEFGNAEAFEFLVGEQEHVSRKNKRRFRPPQPSPCLKIIPPDEFWDMFYRVAEGAVLSDHYFCGVPSRELFERLNGLTIEQLRNVAFSDLWQLWVNESGSVAFSASSVCDVKIAVWALDFLDKVPTKFLAWASDRLSSRYGYVEHYRRWILGCEDSELLDKAEIERRKSVGLANAQYATEVLDDYLEYLSEKSVWNHGEYLRRKERGDNPCLEEVVS